MMNRTIDYYNRYAENFIFDTSNVDFTGTQDKFLSKMQEGSLILDFGCGSGRDSKYFVEQGMQVEAWDGSKELCQLVSKAIGREVRHMFFQELDARDRYDGIWACASILHLSMDDMVDVIGKMCCATKKNGYIYASFKYGDYEGERNGRYFTDMNEERWAEVMRKVPGLSLVEQWISADV